MNQPNPAEQLAREIAREALFLPERWRLWLIEELHSEAEATDLEQHQVEQINQKMSEAVKALARVARHLKLSDEAAIADLTMRQFDAAPEAIREGWRSRQVAKVMRGSWNLAKSVAFSDQRLPVVPAREARRREDLTRKRHEGAFALSGLADWLATEPGTKTAPAYEQWRREHNRQLPEGQRHLPGYFALRRRWVVGWQEIVEAVEQSRIPGEDPAEQDKPKHKPDISLAKRRKAAGRKKPRYVLDSELRAALIRSTREARGWSVQELANRAGLDPSSLAKLERHERRNPSFETIIKLAETLDLDLDDFAKP